MKSLQYSFLRFLILGCPISFSFFYSYQILQIFSSIKGGIRSKARTGKIRSCTSVNLPTLLLFLFFPTVFFFCPTNACEDYLLFTDSEVKLPAICFAFQWYQHVHEGSLSLAKFPHFLQAVQYSGPLSSFPAKSFLNIWRFPLFCHKQDPK